MRANAENAARKYFLCKVDMKNVEKPNTSAESPGIKSLDGTADAELALSEKEKIADLKKIVNEAAQNRH